MPTTDADALSGESWTNTLSRQAMDLLTAVIVHPGPWFTVPAAAAAGALDAATARRHLDALTSAKLLEHDNGRYRVLGPHDAAATTDDPAANIFSAFLLSTDALPRTISWYLHSADNAARAMGLGTRHFPLPDVLPGVAPLQFAAAGFDDARLFLQYERQSLIAAAHAALATEDEAAWQLPAVLMGVYAASGDTPAWLEMSEVGQEAAEQSGNTLGWAAVLEGYSRALLHAGYAQEAAAAQDRALELREQVGDLHGQALSVNVLALIAWRRGDAERADKLFHTAQALAARIGQEQVAVISRFDQGSAWVKAGRVRDGQALLAESRRFFEEHDMPVLAAAAALALAGALRQQGLVTDAFDAATKAVNTAQALGLRTALAGALTELAQSHAALGRPDEAIALLREASALYNALADRENHARTLDLAEQLYEQTGNQAQAAALRSFAAKLRAAHHEHTPNDVAAQ